MLGVDRSEKLLDLCSRKGYETVLCDNLQLPFKNGYFVRPSSIGMVEIGKTCGLVESMEGHLEWLFFHGWVTVVSIQEVSLGGGIFY
jgi:hypothetical protein